MKCYALYSKSAGSYNTPFFAENDDVVINMVRDMVVASNNQALVMTLDDLDLICLGEISLVGGYSTPFDCDVRYPVLKNLHRSLPFPPMIREKIDALYGIEREESNE